MKDTLEQLTLSQFIDLVCGNTDVLLDRHEIGQANKIALATRNIILEYRAIADPGGTGTYFKRIEEWIKSKINVIIFTMCSNLTQLKQYEKAREVLVEYGLSASGWSDSRIDGTIQAKLAKSQRELSILEEENEKANTEKGKIRNQFDAQVASLMAHFKFQIDPSTIKATLYAHLVARFNREVKAQMAAMRK